MSDDDDLRDPMRVVAVYGGPPPRRDSVRLPTTTELGPYERRIVLLEQKVFEHEQRIAEQERRIAAIEKKLAELEPLMTVQAAIIDERRRIAIILRSRVASAVGFQSLKLLADEIEKGISE